MITKWWRMNERNRDKGRDGMKTLEDRGSEQQTWLAAPEVDTRTAEKRQARLEKYEVSSSVGKK
jgi:hypothetical protein